MGLSLHLGALALKLLTLLALGSIQNIDAKAQRRKEKNPRPINPSGAGCFLGANYPFKLDK
jgi:hypothetical protein